jgi:ABC-type branched-subunit amino acid transport system substrate-binding protein
MPLQGNPLKLAVVVPIDYYSEAAREILQGIAEAQNSIDRQGHAGTRPR